MYQLRSAFADLGLRCLPSAGNFLCVDLGCPGQQVFTALLAKGVIVRPVDNYGLPNFLRITVGNEPENRQLIAALGEVLRN
jgi:histidinol-phosphate aminotransferase